MASRQCTKGFARFWTVKDGIFSQTTAIFSEIVKVSPHEALNYVLDLLKNEIRLPAKYRQHELHGEYDGCLE